MCSIVEGRREEIEPERLIVLPEGEVVFCWGMLRLDIVAVGRME